MDAALWCVLELFAEEEETLSPRPSSEQSELQPWPSQDVQELEPREALHPRVNVTPSPLTMEERIARAKASKAALKRLAVSA